MTESKKLRDVVNNNSVEAQLLVKSLDNGLNPVILLEWLTVKKLCVKGDSHYSHIKLFMSEDLKLVKWLMDRYVLASLMKCVSCGLNCKLRKRALKLDGVTWRCQSNKNHKTYVRRYSSLEKSHLSIQDLFEYTRCFLQDMSLKKACGNAGITYQSAAGD